MSSAGYQTIQQEPSALSSHVTAPSSMHGHVRQPDMISEYGGNVFGFVDVILRKLGGACEMLTDDECTMLLCGFFCQPCLIAQALEEVGENWWVTCCTVLVAPNLLGIPYLCFTVPAMNRLNVRLGGQPMTVRNTLCLCLCRPCVACQLAKAVKEAKADGSLARRPELEAIHLGPSAPSSDIMERT